MYFADSFVPGYGRSSRSLEIIKQKIENLTIDMAPHDESAFKKLSNRQIIDAVYSNKDVGYALIKQLALTNFDTAAATSRYSTILAFQKDSMTGRLYTNLIPPVRCFIKTT